MGRYRFSFWKIACIGILAITAIAQDQKVFRSETRLVEVEVVVRDGKGPVQGLKQEDFQLFDNGKPQKIGAFSVVTSKRGGSMAAAPAMESAASHVELPVTATVLLINNLTIAFSDQVQAEKRVAEVFRALPPREPIAVYVRNQELRMLTDFTDDPVRITKALESAWGEQAQPPPSAWCIPPAYPALEKIANELGSLPGRKNLIWFANYFPVSKPSDNVPCPSLAYFAMLRAIKALNTANVAVYPIAAGGVFGPSAFSAARSKTPPMWMNSSQGPSGINGMYWAHESGGTAAQNTDVGFAALRALDDSQVTYSLGFYPETLDGKYHDLKVQVDRKGVDVRSRLGYLASLPVDLSLKTTGDATMQVPYFYTGTDRARVHLSLDVIPAGMTFQKKGKVFHGQIEMVGTTLHADGGEAGRFEQIVDVDMESQERADAFRRAPFHYEHEFLLLAGNYVVQMAVGTGQTKDMVTAPLNIESWHEDAFGISGIAFCAEGESPDGTTPLVAGGRQFVVVGGNRFRAAQPPLAEPPAVPVLHAETRVVQIDVIVEDAHGKPVTGLAKRDFTVMDNGKPRAIDIFSVNLGAADGRQNISSAPTAPTARPQPLGPNVYSNRNAGPPDIPGHSTVIVLDQVNAFFEDAGYARQSVLDLMSKVKPDERIALYVMARKQGLVVVQDYTTDHELLLKSLSRYIPRGPMPLPVVPVPWPIGVQDLAQPKPPGLPPKFVPRQITGPDPEAEAVFQENSEQARLSMQALAEHLSLVPGRKSVYWVTQAFPARLMQGMGQFAWDKTITALNEANVAVNTVDSRGLFHNAANSATIAAMQQVAEETGGKAYFGRNDLDTAMAEGIEASRVTYTLGFYLADNERDNKFHALKVKADRPGLELFYRQGYYAGNTELPVEAKERGELESSLLNQVNATGIGITARIDAVPGTPRGTLNIRLNLDPGTLSLKEKAGGWSGKVEETFVEVNESGNTLSKVSDSKDFEVTGAARAYYDSRGVAWPFSMPLIPGAVKVTIVVRDTATGHVGSLTVPLK